MKDEACNNNEYNSMCYKEHQYLNYKDSYSFKDNEEYKYLNDKYSKICAYDEKKYRYGCYNTAKLNEILSFYKENNTELRLISKNQAVSNNLYIGDMYINDIRNDIAYISRGSVNNPVEYIIPLDQIEFIGTIVDREEHKCIEEIVNKKARRKEKCCSSYGRVKAIKDAANYFTSMGITISDNVRIVILESESYVGLSIFGSMVIVFGENGDFGIKAASDEIILVKGILINDETRIVEYVIPTCLISGVEKVSRGDSIVDSNEEFNTFN